MSMSTSGAGPVPYTREGIQLLTKSVYNRLLFGEGRCSFTQETLAHLRPVRPRPVTIQSILPSEHDSTAFVGYQAVDSPSRAIVASETASFRSSKESPVNSLSRLMVHCFEAVARKNQFPLIQPSFTRFLRDNYKFQRVISPQVRVFPVEAQAYGYVPHSRLPVPPTLIEQSHMDARVEELEKSGKPKKITNENENPDRRFDQCQPQVAIHGYRPGLRLLLEELSRAIAPYFGCTKGVAKEIVRALNDVDAPPTVNKEDDILAYESLFGANPVTDVLTVDRVAAALFQNWPEAREARMIVDSGFVASVSLRCPICSIYCCSLHSLREIPRWALDAAPWSRKKKALRPLRLLPNPGYTTRRVLCQDEPLDVEESFLAATALGCSYGDLQFASLLTRRRPTDCLDIVKKAWFVDDRFTLPEEDNDTSKFVKRPPYPYRDGLSLYGFCTHAVKESVPIPVPVASQIPSFDHTSVLFPLSYPPYGHPDGMHAAYGASRELLGGALIDSKRPADPAGRVHVPRRQKEVSEEPSEDHQTVGFLEIDEMGCWHPGQPCSGKIMDGVCSCHKEGGLPCDLTCSCHCFPHVFLHPQYDGAPCHIDTVVLEEDHTLPRGVAQHCRKIQRKQPVVGVPNSGDRERNYCNYLRAFCRHSGHCEYPDGRFPQDGDKYPRSGACRCIGQALSTRAAMPISVTCSLDLCSCACATTGFCASNQRALRAPLMVLGPSTCLHKFGPTGFHTEMPELMHAGLGVFAAESIPAGRVLGQYTGYRADFETGEILTPKKLSYLFAVKARMAGPRADSLSRFHVDAAAVGNVLRFINSSDRNHPANVVAVEEQQMGDTVIRFTTQTYVHVGQELLFDYQFSDNDCREHGIAMRKTGKVTQKPKKKSKKVSRCEWFD